MNNSYAFSILKTAYGWNGCTVTGEHQAALDSILENHHCERCAARDMAAFIHDNCGVGYFRARIDGRPNTYSVDRDRAGNPVFGVWLH